MAEPEPDPDADREPDAAGDAWHAWLAPRVERRDWQLPSGATIDAATYRVVGGQDQAFEALRAFSDRNLEPVVVDLEGLDDRMRATFLEFIEGTGLRPLEWIGEDVVVLMTSFGQGPGGSGVREPIDPRPPPRHLAVEAPLAETQP